MTNIKCMINQCIIAKIIYPWTGHGVTYKEFSHFEMLGENTQDISVHAKLLGEKMKI